MLTIDLIVEKYCSIVSEDGFAANLRRHGFSAAGIEKAIKDRRIDAKLILGVISVEMVRSEDVGQPIQSRVLHQRCGKKAALKRKAYFERSPHLHQLESLVT